MATTPEAAALAVIEQIYQVHYPEEIQLQKAV
jgi:hypothetical protein